MKVYSLTDYYYINDIEQHLVYKDKILSAIDKMPDTYSKAGYEQITKFDYVDQENMSRSYISYFRELIEPYIQKIGDELKCFNYFVHGVWFQQYYQNDFHNWHNHHSCNFSNVYFLEMPDNDLKTQLYDLNKNNIIEIEGIQEGSLLTFPAHYIHRSPKNLNNNRKTIIAFNTSYDNVDYSYINNKLGNIVE